MSDNKTKRKKIRNKKTKANIWVVKFARIVTKKKKKKNDKKENTANWLRNFERI